MDIKMKKGEKKAEVLIYEDIGDSWFGGINAKDFAKEIQALGKLDEINVRINSAGGSVFDGVAIYNTLLKNEARITVDIDGLAASIASIIAMAGDTVSMAENAFMMIHDPWAMALGTAEDMRKMADNLDAIRETLLNTYVNRSVAKAEDISRMMTEETWFNAQEALDAGLIDTITAEMKIAAHLDKRLLGKFNKVPDQLNDSIKAFEKEQETPRKSNFACKKARMNVVLQKRRM